MAAVIGENGGFRFSVSGGSGLRATYWTSREELATPPRWITHNTHEGFVEVAEALLAARTAVSWRRESAGESMSKPPGGQSRTALVTGASSGIGRSLAECFAADGINLVLSARSAAALEALAAEWRERYGIAVLVVPADLEQSEAAQALRDEITAAGIELDYLVNNAGYGLYGLFQDLPLEQQLAMMHVNMIALTALTKLFLPDILRRQGKILNVASVAAFAPGPHMSVYFASKAYVLSFSEALASELEGSGVTVTALCPGPTRSGFMERAAMARSALFKRSRLPSSEEVAAAGYRAMQRGRRVFVPGLLNYLQAQSVRVAPRRLVAQIAKLATRPMTK